MTGSTENRTAPKPVRIVVVGAQPEYLSNMRGQLLRDLVAAGHEVTAVGAEENSQVRAALEGWGVRYEVVRLDRTSLNPLADFRAVLAFRAFFRAARPDVMFVYTTKSIALGLLGAAAAAVPRRYAMIAGRGYALSQAHGLKGRLRRFVTMALLALSLRAAHGVIFQNDDDMAMFRRAGLVPRATPVTRVFGSGVELDRFARQPLPPGPMTYLLVGRLLRSKGIPEFVAAARRIRAEFPDTRFVVVGPADRRGDAITEAELEAWRREGIVEFVGPVSEVRPHLASCHVFVLPSIGEGVPRSVLEAMAVGRPVITADTPGCRDTVLQDRSGILVPYGDSEALAEAMSRFARDRRYLESAAAESRRLAETRFDARAVSLAIRRAMALA